MTGVRLRLFLGRQYGAGIGALNLLYASGSATPTETGLKIAKNGVIAFALSQTFSGTGPGTITGITAGTGLTGGGTKGNVTLNLDTTKVPELTVAKHIHR